MAMQRISEMSAYICSLVLSLALIAYLCHNLNVPGSHISRYYQSEHTNAKINSLRSLKSWLLLDYYILPSCKSLGRSRESAEFSELLLLGKALTHERSFSQTIFFSGTIKGNSFAIVFLGTSIVRPVLTIVILTGFLCINISKKVPKNLCNFEDLDEEGQASLSKGTLKWKLVMGDAFREPSFSKLLCVMVGNGIQIAGTGIATMILGALGFISPKLEAMLVTGMMCFCLVFGFVAGYVGVWLWRNIKGSSQGWSSLCCSIACLFIISFSIFIALNIWSANGNTVFVCFPLYLTLLVQWFGLSALLTILGGFMATKSGKQIRVPVETDQNPREVPAPQSGSLFLSVATGIFPFSTIFDELFFLFPLIWHGRSYDEFEFLSEEILVGFLPMAAILLTVACAEVSVASAYRCLCTRDWKWWWKAFFASGSVGFYVFIFSINYLALDIGGWGRPASVALYLGYSVILAFAVMLSTGAVGFLTAFYFIHYLALSQ